MKLPSDEVDGASAHEALIAGKALTAELDKPKKPKRTSPTQRCLAECRRRGWTAQVVEKFVRFPPPGHRVDLFGVIDIIAIVPEDGETTGRRIVGIQASPGPSHASHRTKILAEPRAKEWFDAGARLELWSWAQRGGAGLRKRWTLRVETYQDMLAGHEAK